MSAQSGETQNLLNDVVNFMPHIRGDFGCDRARWWSITYGMNEKRGMDKADFAAHIRNCICPLYLNYRDVPGKRVLIKVESGLVWFNIYLFPNYMIMDSSCILECLTLLPSLKKWTVTMVPSIHCSVKFWTKSFTNRLRGKYMCFFCQHFLALSFS